MKKIINILFLSLLLVSSFSSQNAAVVSDSEVGKWRADLSYLASQMVKIHPNLFFSLSKSDFEQKVSQLNRSIPKLARHEIIVEFKRLVASIKDGHSNLPLVFSFHGTTSKTGFRKLPLTLYIFDDGVYVTTAAAKYGEMVGGRVLRVGNFDIGEVINKVGDLVAHENEMTPKERLPDLIIIPEVLNALKISKDINSIRFLLEINGKQKEFTVKPLTEHDEKPWVKAGGNGPPPLSLKKTYDPYWFEYLADSKTVYFQYNAVDNRRDGDSLKVFFSKLFKFIEKNNVDRLVIDLRLNTGGNGVRNWDMIYGIIRSDKINQKGKLFVITGRKTFSAGTHAAVLLDSHTNSIIVGEPSSGNINSYGDHQPFNLPNSGILAFVSKYYHQNTYPWDKRTFLEPKVKVENSFEDFRKNRDAALDSILEYGLQK